MRRRHVNKRKSARNFRNATRHTRKINIANNMRGGIRL